MPDRISLIDNLSATLRKVAMEAGDVILRLRAEGCPVETKQDETPVTRADREAEATILRRLADIFPGIGILAEEACAAGQDRCSTGPVYFLVDPLDGTREFIAGRDEFTVNIALIQGSFPVAGVVLAPATGECFTGSPQGAEKHVRMADGTWSTGYAIGVRHVAPAERIALASRSHRTAATKEYLARLTPAHVEPLGSSLKFCRIAEGVADVYPCLGPTMAWDTAAGQAVLEAAGGHVRNMEGMRLAYGVRAGKSHANPFFVASADADVPCG